MRNTRYGFLVLLSSLLMLTGCSRRDILDDYPVSGVDIKLDWDGVTDQLPEGVRVIFYPKNGDGRKVDKYLSVRGGEMKVPPGRYSVVAYNYNTESIRIRGEESYETIEAYTGNCNGLGIEGTEKMVWSPDSLYVLNIDELKIEKSEEVLRLDWKLESVVKKYSFAVEAKGLEYVATVVGSIDGLSDCYCIGKGRGVCSSQPIYFEVRKGDNKVTASFTAFKQVKEMTMPTRMSTSERETSSEKDAIILILKFIKTDNTVQEATIDVTEIIGTLENAGTGEDGKPTPPPEIELPPDDKISIMVPCYNEEENVIPLSEALIEMFAKDLPQYDYDITFIDNDSTDTTRVKLRQLCEGNKKIKAIFNAKNFGQFNSPYYGIINTDGDCTIPVCADFQDPIDVIPRLVAEWEKGYKIVCAVKSSSKESKIMYFLRTCYYKLIKKMSSVEQIEHFTGFGLYDKSFVQVMKDLKDPIPFLRGVVGELGFKRTEIEYTQAQRRAGIMIRDCSNYVGLTKGYYRICVKEHKDNKRLINEIISFRGM